MADGSKVVVPRKKVKFRDGAVPSKFPGQPTYMTASTSKPREGVATQREAVQTRRDEAALCEYFDSDIIENFEHFQTSFRDKIGNNN